MFRGLGGPRDSTGNGLGTSSVYDHAVRNFGMDGLLCGLYRAAGLPARVVYAYASIPEPVYFVPENEFEADERTELGIGLALFHGFSKVLIALGCEPEEMAVTELPTPGA